MSKVPITPLADYVVVQQEAAQTKTASGLYLPDKGAEKPKIATVLSVGPAVRDIKAGDKVVLVDIATPILKSRVLNTC